MNLPGKAVRKVKGKHAPGASRKRLRGTPASCLETQHRETRAIGRGDLAPGLPWSGLTGVLTAHTIGMTESASPMPEDMPIVRDPPEQIFHTSNDPLDVETGSGDDTIVGGAGDDSIDGGADNDGNDRDQLHFGVAIDDVSILKHGDDYLIVSEESLDRVRNVEEFVFTFHNLV